MIEFRRGWRRRNDHQRRTYRTLIAVRGTVHNGECVASLLLCYESSGSAAIQIDGSHTAGVQHDLRQFLCATAGREGLLTTVKDHHNDLAITGNAHTGTRMTAIVIGVGLCSDKFAILDKECAAAYCLLNLILISSVIAGSADHCRAILQDRKKVFSSNSVIFNALHDQRTTGSASGHVVEIRVDTNHRIVVFHIVFRVRRIGMPLLGCRHLIGYARHSPALRRVIGMIVCANIDVLARNIHSSNVVNDLLFILGQSIFDCLRDTGSDRCRVGGEDGIVRVIRVGFRLRIGFRINRIGAVGIARQIKQIVRKRVATRLTQSIAVGKVGQRIRAFQCPNQRVGAVDTEHLAPNALLCDHTAQTVGQKIGSAVSFRKLRSQVALHDCTQCYAATIHLRGDIKRVQVTVEIGVSKRMIDLV